MTTDPSFRMTVSDVFSIRGRGTVVTGKIESGTLRVGDKIRISGQGGSSMTAVVTGLETMRRTQTEVAAGENVGVLLREVAKSDIRPGDRLESEEGMDFSWKP